MNKKKLQPSDLARQEGVSAALAHPLYSEMRMRTISADASQTGMVSVNGDGVLSVHPKMHASKDEWTWAVAHALTHLGFGHHQAGASVPEREKNLELCLEVNRFLATLKIGKAPGSITVFEGGTEDMRRVLAASPLPVWGSNGVSADLVWSPERKWGNARNWEDAFSQGLRRAVQAAVMVAGGELEDLSGTPGRKKAWELALSWFAREYPLLGGVAAGLTLIDDKDVILRERISIAAVSAELGELYVNPHAGLSTEEWKFVMAHEMLHVGLRHDIRVGGRDHEIFNVACDLVINQWLVDMKVGTIPAGVLYDPALKGLSAEEVYDRIINDSKHYRKLMTLRGVGIGDILGRRLVDHHEHTTDLDAYYRRALAEGLDVHIRQGRGTLPGGLIEEIRALEAPPVPWDVELAAWFDERFPALEAERTYARPSRRQGSTPDIPRPSRHLPFEDTLTRTFAVVLDTSGSMDRHLLGKALGTIASYALSRDVGHIRLVFCDAVAYDEGYVTPDDIAQRARVRGRGGTILQPGVELVQNAKDFPEDGPILVITDGGCERSVKIKRDHAYVIPANAHLPFTPAGPVFRIS